MSIDKYVGLILLTFIFKNLMSSGLESDFKKLSITPSNSRPSNLPAFPQNYETALKLFNGEIEGYPKGHPKTLEQAAKIFKPLAEQGNAKAMYQLGCIYHKQQNICPAYQWIFEAQLGGIKEAPQALKIL